MHAEYLCGKCFQAARDRLLLCTPVKLQQNVTAADSVEEKKTAGKKKKDKDKEKKHKKKRDEESEKS